MYIYICRIERFIYDGVYRIGGEKMEIKKMSMLVKDYNKRLIEGYASVQIKDMQGDYVPIETMKRAMIDFIDRGGVLAYGHSNHIIGKILSFWVDEYDGKEGIKILAKIYNGDRFADEVWEKIKRGELKGFSIGGIVDNAVEKDGMRVLEDLTLHEISVVSEPANPDAIIEDYSIAKGEIVEKDCKDKYMADKHHFKEMTCPNSDEKSKFCGCVRYQMSCNDKSEDSARKICAEIYHRKYGGNVNGISMFKSVDSCVEYMKDSMKYSEDVAKGLCEKIMSKFSDEEFVKSFISSMVLGIERFKYDDVYGIKESDKMVEKKEDKIEEEKEDEEKEEEEKEEEERKEDEKVEKEDEEVDVNVGTSKMDILLQSVAELNDKMAKLLERLGNISDIVPEQKEEKVEKRMNDDIVKVKEPEPPADVKENAVVDTKTDVIRKLLNGEISPKDAKNMIKGGV